MCTWMTVIIMVVCGVFNSSKPYNSYSQVSQSTLTLCISTLCNSFCTKKQATSKAKLFGFFNSSSSPVTDCLFEAKLYTWNQLEGAGMCCMDLELICRAGMAILRETDQGRGNVGQCYVPAGDGVWRPPSLGCWSGATTPFSHHPILFHPTEFPLRLEIVLSSFWIT